MTVRVDSDVFQEIRGIIADIGHGPYYLDARECRVVSPKFGGASRVDRRTADSDPGRYLVIRDGPNIDLYSMAEMFAEYEMSETVHIGSDAAYRRFVDRVERSGMGSAFDMFLEDMTWSETESWMHVNGVDVCDPDDVLEDGTPDRQSSLSDFLRRHSALRVSSADWMHLVSTEYAFIMSDSPTMKMVSVWQLTVSSMLMPASERLVIR